MDSNQAQGIERNDFSIILNFNDFLVMIYLSWDSEAVNRTQNVPPMYRVYKEFQKPQNEQNCELLKYRYDFLKTIVEAIKTVSPTNVSPIVNSILERLSRTTLQDIT